MRILVLCDDYYHPARTCRLGLAPLVNRNMRFDYVENANNFSVGTLTDYPMAMLIKSNDVSSQDRTEWMTETIQHGFRNYVEEGGGLFAVHSGTAGYKDASILRALLGGVFMEHPKQCPVTIEPVAGQPMAFGCDPFTIQDEHYQMALDAHDAEVFVTSSSEHGSQPAGWTRMEGEGRVCVLTPGHNLSVWLNVDYQQLLKNGIQWCGAGKLPL